MESHVLLALLLLFMSFAVFDASDASFVWEHRKLANSDAKDGENAKKDSPVPNQDNSDPNPVGGTKNKEESPSPSNDNDGDNTKLGKGAEGSNNSHNANSPAPAPSPKVKDSNGAQEDQNKKASPSVAEDDGKGNGKDGGKEGNGKDGGTEGNGKDGGKEDKGKDGGEQDNGKDGGEKDNAKDGGKEDKRKDGSQKDNGKDGGEKDKGKDGSKGNGNENEESEGKTISQSTTNESCDELKKCKDNGGMVGCISKLDPAYVVVLLHNGGTDTIKVKLSEGNLEDIEVGTQQTKKVNISLITSEKTQLIFNAGKGDCLLPMGTLVPKEGDFFVRLPSYDKILTPVNGAYFLILTVLVFGGTWACCKFRKKRPDEVPYQELEMAMPETASAPNVESAEGWDQVWDDDWDDDVAVKSPATCAGSISANGLTSRSSNKDGWENNWDD